ncbi:MAG: aldehyde dehydrogenase family protein [Gemmatimonadales bacterium]
MPDTLASLDPVTGLAFAEAPIPSAADIQRMMAAARVAQAQWAHTSFAERRAVLRRFQHLLFAQRRAVAELISRETGKPLAEALLTDLAVTLDLARYYVDRGAALLRPERIRLGNIAFLGRRAHLCWDPLGVIAVIAPWNYPLLLPFGDILAALLAGNGVLLKPSEYTTQVALAGVALLHRAGVPASLCQVVVGGADSGAALIEAGPDKIFFTGSVRTGTRVAEQAAARLIPVNLELGGSDPCLVLADADLERAASGVTWARFTNSGQTCVAAKRVIVEQAVHDRFVDLLIERAERLQLGPGLVPGSEVGPVIRMSQLVALERQLADAVSRGAQIRCGGRRRPELGETFFEPTVVTDVPPASALWREEVFGPVLAVVAARDTEEALRLANDSVFALSGSIWTGDRARGAALARRIAGGVILVNDATSHVGAAEIPHGGDKSSGLGRTHGALGLREMVRPKVVVSDWLDGMRKPWWFGYAADSLPAREAFLQLSYGPTWWSRLRAIPGALRLLFNRRAV